MKRHALAAALCAGALFASAANAQTYSAATVGITAANVSASPAVYLDLVNLSPTATICLNFTTTATITGTACAAGEITLPPLWHRDWPAGIYPRGTLSAIASAASTPLSVGVR